MTATAVESLIVYLALLIGALFTLIAAVRARAIQLRTIPAYQSLPRALDATVETGKALHVSLGASAVRQESTLSALAGAEVLYHVAERAAISDASTLVTLSDPVTLGLAQDALRRAYRTRNRLDKYRPISVHWYPQGPSSLAFAAGAGAVLLDESVTTNVLLGRFGPELALLAENALRTNQTIVAQSDQIEGQAVAYAITPTPLIGEELYVGGAYLSSSPLARGGVVALDVLRYLTVTLIFLTALYVFLFGGR
ncbi:MAG: DUF6754 domain-containing protein [Aggregatilineales bacterium]